MTILIALLAGACWRRWFGSERPGWAFPGYRAMQVAAGVAALFLLAWLSTTPAVAILLAGGAIGFMTLPISVSRAPFVWFADRLPLPTIPYVSGSAEWAEVFQGALIFAGAIALAHIF